MRAARDQLFVLNREPEIDSTSKLAAFALADFSDRILDDLTRAVPWDDVATVGKARNLAMKLAHEAFEKLAEFAARPRDSAEFFSTLGSIRNKYEQLIDSLNDQDRMQLAALGRN